MVANVEFAAPSESIYGFEYEATTAEEIAARDGAISALENRFGEMFQLPDALGCRVVEAYVEIKIGTEFDVGDRADPDDGAGDPTGSDNGVRDDERVGERVGAPADHVPPGEHVEVHTTYRLECAADLVGARARVTIGNFFPGIRTVNVIVLSASGQHDVTLEGGSGSIDL